MPAKNGIKTHERNILQLKVALEFRIAERKRMGKHEDFIFYNRTDLLVTCQ